MRVLVTGGAGFIGSHLVASLLDEGFDVRVLDNFSTGRHENLRSVAGHIDLREGDVRGLETVQRAMEGVEIVLHQAALPSVARSIEDPAVSNEVNLGGTLNVLIGATKAGVRRVVLASSSSVYGDGSGLPKDESMQPSPKSPYAVTKLASEHYCSVFTLVHGLETIALRYFNVFGPRQDPTSHYSGVIALFVTAALAGDACTVFGDGTQTRDFTYVENVVGANLLALASPGPLRGEVVNVACGVRISLLEMIAALGALVGRDIPIAFAPERSGDVAHSQATIEKARELIGYRPTTQFTDGLAKTVAWYAGSTDRPG